MVDISNWIARPVLDTKFKSLIKNIGEFNIDTGPWIAGGSIRKLWQGIDWHEQDIDIFFSNRKNCIAMIEDFELKYNTRYKMKSPITQEPTLEGTMSFADMLSTTDQPIHKSTSLKDDPFIDSIHHSDNATTFTLSGFNSICSKDRKLEIQFISRSFPNSIIELLKDFDWTICQFISDGITMWATPDAIRDLDRKEIILVPGTTRKITFKRLTKYLSYGFNANDDLMIKMMEFLESGQGIGVEDDYA